MNGLLMGKAQATADVHNIVPIDLLNPRLTLGEIAGSIKGVLTRKFKG